MLTRLSKDVVCIKDIQSNVIEEAFFILKTNLNDSQSGNKRREIVTMEIDGILDEYSQKITSEKAKYQKEMERQQNKKTAKRKAFAITSIVVVCCLIILLCKM